MRYKCYEEHASYDLMQEFARELDEHRKHDCHCEDRIQDDPYYFFPISASHRIPPLALRQPYSFMQKHMLRKVAEDLLKATECGMRRKNEPSGSGPFGPFLAHSSTSA